MSTELDSRIRDALTRQVQDLQVDSEKDLRRAVVASRERRRFPRLWVFRGLPVGPSQRPVLLAASAAVIFLALIAGAILIAAPRQETPTSTGELMVSPSPSPATGLRSTDTAPKQQPSPAESDTEEGEPRHTSTSPQETPEDVPECTPDELRLEIATDRTSYEQGETIEATWRMTSLRATPCWVTGPVPSHSITDESRTYGYEVTPLPMCPSDARCGRELSPGEDIEGRVELVTKQKECSQEPDCTPPGRYEVAVHWHWWAWGDAGKTSTWVELRGPSDSPAPTTPPPGLFP